MPPTNICKGNQGNASSSSNIGMSAIASIGAKNLPSHSNMVNKMTMMENATKISMHSLITIAHQLKDTTGRNDPLVHNTII